MTALEPSPWSGSQDESSFLKLQSVLEPEGSVSVVSTRFQEFHSESRFDLVVLHNSINHLDEELVSDVHRSDTARAAYREILGRIIAMLKPGGVVLLADCGRLNFFGGLGISNPFAPSIEWNLHQEPSTWVSLLESVGCKCKVEWNSLSITGRPGRILLGNRCGSFFTTSHFTIRAEHHPGHMNFSQN